MRKLNTLIIILFLVCLAFVLGSKSKREYPKWEYAYYSRGSTGGFSKYSKDIPSLLYIWQEPGKKVIDNIGIGLAPKLKIGHGLDIKHKVTSVWPYNLFQYAGEQGWELVFKEKETEGVDFTYWFKRPKLN